MSWLVEIAWKSTVVMAAGFAANYALRRLSAATRHFVWTVMFAAMLMLPAARLAPQWSPAVAAPETAGLKPGQAATVLVVKGAAPVERRVPVEWIYLAGAMLVAVRFAIGIGRTAKMVRGADAAESANGALQELRSALGISRPVRVLETAEASVPMTWGIFRPVVLLPVAAHSWPTERMRAVLLHELVHVRRHDLLAQTLAQAACCLCWFHPLAWLAARELRKEREAACDDAVLNRGLAPAEYAGHLMELARSMAGHRAGLADAPAMAESSDLESRVRALLDRGRNRAPLSRRVAVAVSVLACCLAMPVATLTTHAQAGRGELAGIVRDPSTARVPGCTIIARNLDGQNQETATAGRAGDFHFAAIPPGRYEIEVRAPGFKPAKKDIIVTAGTSAQADISLEVGTISESVTVHMSRNSPPPSQNAARTAVRIPIGGNVRMARLLRQPKPEYPQDLKQQGITGTVRIKAVISKTGELLEPTVINTDVHPGLAQAALDNVRQWRYEPTLLNGQPVEVVTTIEVHFELDQ